MPRSGFRVDRKPPEMFGRLRSVLGIASHRSSKSATASCGGPARGGCLSRVGVCTGSCSDPSGCTGITGADPRICQLASLDHLLSKAPIPSRRVMGADVALTHRQVPSAAASCGAHRPMELRGRKAHRSSSSARTASGRIRQMPRNGLALDGLTVDRNRPMGKRTCMHSWPKVQFQDSKSGLGG